jgi:hypothetical protein
VDNQHKFIKGYRDLSEREIWLINEIKIKAEEIGALLEKMRHEDCLDQRAVAIAKTEMQTAFMWAVRSVAQPTSF